MRMRSWRKIAAIMLSAVLLVNMMYYGDPVPVYAEGSDNLVKSVDNANPLIGEEFTYTIKYTYPSTSGDGQNVKIIDELPAGLVYVSSIPSADVEGTSVGTEHGRTVVTFDMGNLEAGKTGVLKIMAKFPAGKMPARLPEGEVKTFAPVSNSARMTGDDISDVNSNAVAVTPQVKDPDFSIVKEKLIPQGDAVIGQPVTYRIMISGNSSIGGLDFTGVSLRDDLPAGAVYVSSSDGGTASNGVVAWNIETLKAGQNIVRTVKVRYPAGTFNVNDEVTNTAKIAVTDPFDESNTLEKDAQAKHGFGPAEAGIGGFNKHSRQTNDEYSVGQTAKFWLGGIGNTGNIPLDRVEIVDDIPAHLDLTQISTGLYNEPVTVAVSYQTEGGEDWIPWQVTTPSTAVVSLLVSDIELPTPATAAKITKVKWVLTGEGGIPSGFTETTDIEVFGTVQEPAPQTTITNTAHLEACYGGEKISRDDSETIYVIDQRAWPVADKKTEGGRVKYNQKEIVTYELIVKNHEFATGNYVNPVAVDVLPAEMDLTGAAGLLGESPGPYTYTLSSSNPNNSITASAVADMSTETIGGVNHHVMKWKFTGSLAPGEYITISYKVKIPDNALQGVIENDLYATSSASTLFQGKSGALEPVPTMAGKQGKKDGNTIIVNFTGSIEAHKWVKGELDNPSENDGWTKFTSVGTNHGKTLPGGIADYRLSVKNSGANGPIRNLVLVDIFPYPEDKEILNGSIPRGSDWRANLVNEIKVVSFKDKNGHEKGSLPVPQILYSTVTNPSLAGLNDPAGKGGVADSGWSATLPADITAVRALKIYFPDTVLDPGDEITLGWPMRTPVGAPPLGIAWNSFAYGATYPDIEPLTGQIVQEPFLPSEPIKVGFMVQSTDPVATYRLGNYVWEDMNGDGLQNDGETGINGILVNLYEDGKPDVFRYTRAGGDQNGNPGYYSFPNLPDGDYVVEFVYPQDYKVTPGKAGSDDALNSDVSTPVTPGSYDDIGTSKYKVSAGTIPLNSQNPNIDLGLYKLASVGNLVWHDQDADGIQDSGEPGIDGVTVQLLDKDGNQARDASGSLVLEQSTSGGGKYKFENLKPGDYKIRFVNPSDMYKFSPPESDPTAVNGNNAQPNGVTAVFSLQSGENRTDIDGGMYLGRIGNYIWHDKNADGIQNDASANLSGVKVELTDESDNSVTDAYGATIASKTTDSNGIYLFENLKPGTYKVKVTLPTGYDKFSPKGGGTANDSDVDDGGTTSVTLAAGERNLDIDAGVYKLASIGDLAWNDKNANGVQDTGEPGLAGVTVTLLDSSGNQVTVDGKGNPIAPKTTPSEGNYFFSNLKPGSYKIQFDLGSGTKYVFSTPNQGNDNSDSDAVLGGTSYIAQTGAYTLASGANNTSVDAGAHKAILGDLVWEDMNANGKWETGEPGIQGVPVYLMDEVGATALGTTYTDTSGKYEFNNLDGGNYRIRFELPAGLPLYAQRGSRG